MEGVVHYLFWATGVEFATCPEDLVPAKSDNMKVLCGQSTSGFAEFQILLDAAVIKMRREEGPSVTPMSPWAVENGRQIRSFGCCQSTFEIQSLENRSLVMAILTLPVSITMPSGPSTSPAKPPRPPATGEVILQPGDPLLGPATTGDGGGRYSITIASQGEARRVRMTWEQSKSMTAAYKAGINGKVFLDVLVAPDGQVESATVASSTAPDLGFEQAALLALGQWSADPSLLGGSTTATAMQVVVQFQVPGSSP